MEYLWKEMNAALSRIFVTVATVKLRELGPLAILLTVQGEHAKAKANQVSVPLYVF